MSIMENLGIVYALLGAAIAVLLAGAAVAELIQKLPYQLTKAQMKVWREISERILSSTVFIRHCRL